MCRSKSAVRKATSRFRSWWNATDNRYGPSETVTARLHDFRAGLDAPEGER
jgi:hypothetical protein